MLYSCQFGCGRVLFMCAMNVGKLLCPFGCGTCFIHVCNECWEVGVLVWLWDVFYSGVL